MADRFAVARARFKSGRAPYLFLIPYGVLTAVFFAYPFVNAITLAFYQTNGPKSKVFVGLDNFSYLLHDAVFHVALYNTTLFALASVFLQLPLSMGLALLVHSLGRRSRGVLRLLLFSPNLVGQLFVGILFSVLLMPRYGLLNRATHTLFAWGLEAQWLDDPTLVMPAIVLTSLWIWVGFNMIYFLAGLQSVDDNLVDAARIDGAGAIEVFRHVTLPSIRHVIVFVVLMSIIGSYQLFELPLALLSSTDGFGPNNAGLTLITYLNSIAFRSGDLGLGSAVGWVVAIIIFSVSLLQARLFGGYDE